MPDEVSQRLAAIRGRLAGATPESYGGNIQIEHPHHRIDDGLNLAQFIGFKAGGGVDRAIDRVEVAGRHARDERPGVGGLGGGRVGVELGEPGDLLEGRDRRGARAA